MKNTLLLMIILSLMSCSKIRTIQQQKEMLNILKPLPSFRYELYDSRCKKHDLSLSKSRVYSNADNIILYIMQPFNYPLLSDCQSVDDISTTESRTLIIEILYDFKNNIYSITESKYYTKNIKEDSLNNSYKTPISTEDWQETLNARIDTIYNENIKPIFVIKRTNAYLFLNDEMGYIAKYNLNDKTFTIMIENTFLYINSDILFEYRSSVKKYIDNNYSYFDLKN